MSRDCDLTAYFAALVAHLLKYQGDCCSRKICQAQILTLDLGGSVCVSYSADNVKNYTNTINK